MNDFIEERLLDCVRYGTRYGAEFRTEVRTLNSGFERRASKWVQELGSFTLIYSAMTPEGRAQVMSAFRTCKGRAYGFRLKDWSDYIATDEEVVVAAGGVEQAQLVMNTMFGIEEVQREIKKPVAGKVQLYADGAPIPSVVDLTTGIVEFTASAGEVITWSGEFDKPVRFDSDRIQWSFDNRQSVDVDIMSTDIDLTEIRI